MKLSDSKYFGVNLYDVGLGDRVENLFAQMLAGTGAVRKVLSQMVDGWVSSITFYGNTNIFGVCFWWLFKEFFTTNHTKLHEQERRISHKGTKFVFDIFYKL